MTVIGKMFTFSRKVLKLMAHGLQGKGMSRINADGPGIGMVSVVRLLSFLDL